MPGVQGAVACQGRRVKNKMEAGDIGTIGESAIIKIAVYYGRILGRACSMASPTS